MKKDKGKSPDAAELRRRAEDRLNEKNASSGPPQADQDLPRLIHELQVHQIELEMQNEELLSARAEVEAGLRRYMDLYDFAPVGYFTFGRDGEIRQVNLAGASLLGVERSRLVGRRFGLWVSAGDRPAFDAYLERVFANQATEFCEATIPREGTSALAVRIEAAATEDGRQCRAAVVDITKRMRAEEQARLQAAALEAAADSVVVTDANGTILSVNRAFGAMTGYTAEEVVGQTHRILKSGEQDEAFYRGLWETIRRGETWRGELVNRRKDGTLYYDTMTITPLKDEAGRITHYVAIKRDITERKRIEDAQLFLTHCGCAAPGGDFFKSLARYLAESLKMDYVCIDRLQSDGLTAQTVAVHFDGEFEDNVAYALKDTPCGDAVGKAFCCFPGDVRRLFPRDVVLQEMRAESYVGTTLWGSTGQPIGLIALISRQPLADPRVAESMLRLVALHAAHELERTDAEEALRETAANLARSNEDLEQFAYVASHDLQEPLRQVTGYMHLIKERYKGKLDAAADEFIDFAADGARRMSQLINDLLAYSRVGTRGAELRPTDSNDVVEGVLGMLQFTIEDNHAVVTHDPLPTVHGDATQLKQLFQNLVGNAIKFHGEEPPRIHVGVRLVDGMWQFSVSDNGIGMDAQHFDRVFLMFQRLHTREQYPGTGMGLAICKKIVERHGGRIWVESEPGRGSVFYFTLSADMSVEREALPA